MFDIDITKKAGAFMLNARLKSDSKRLGILGASGSGKSMLLKCIAGIASADKGHIAVGGRALYDSEKRINLKPRKRSVGYLFQNYALFPAMSVEKNIMSAIGSADRKERAYEAARRFGLDEHMKKFPSELSGGQQQRTAFARMWAAQPSVMLLDEPFSALDAYLKRKIRCEALKILEDFDGEVIVVSHDCRDLSVLCDETAVLDDGEIVESGATRQVINCPRTAAAARLTDMEDC